MYVYFSVVLHGSGYCKSLLDCMDWQRVAYKVRYDKLEHTTFYFGRPLVQSYRNITKQIQLDYCKVSHLNLGVSAEYRKYILFFMKKYQRTYAL